MPQEVPHYINYELFVSLFFSAVEKTKIVRQESWLANIDVQNVRLICLNFSYLVKSKSEIRSDEKMQTNYL